MVRNGWHWFRFVLRIPFTGPSGFAKGSPVVLTTILVGAWGLLIGYVKSVEEQLCNGDQLTHNWSWWLHLDLALLALDFGTDLCLGPNLSVNMVNLGIKGLFFKSWFKIRQLLGLAPNRCRIPAGP